jgi:hypothetical protein
VKYVARQDHILICAVLRVWRARMRGKRLERFKTSQIMRNTWSVWKSQYQHRQAQLSIQKFHALAWRLADSSSVLFFRRSFELCCAV